ncbi:MAG TPA: YdeI/OmpD-associated family protein [Candidatus Limnocylindria bacterium]|jgi:uncharacterized protein YdeI (YjbR/CyaY-like superfamily)|nr:YdeI/OmpD-associated family protein [Candidatus Limnocylindria bacterium]
MKDQLDPRVDAYIAEAAPFAQPILRHLRQLVHQGCPAAKENIKWNHPHFEYGGMFCHFAAFKAHCSFGFWHQEMMAVIAKDGGKSESAMGQFGRIATLEDLPDDRTLLRYIATAAKLNESGKPARPRPAPKPKVELVVPDDLAALLKKNKKAAATWDKFSYSHRKEYLEWITEAKREETRQKRLATTVEWLNEGKGRNWKYENC